MIRNLSLPTLPSSYSKLRHIAIIMDGNGRWAKNRQLPRGEGHKAGLKAAYRIVEIAAKLELEVLTLFAFSSENLQRPQQEVSNLLSLFLKVFKRGLTKLVQNNIRLRVIGQVTQFGPELQRKIKLAERRSALNTGLTLVIAAGYGGQWDIVQAMKKVIAQVVSGKLSLDSLNTVAVSSYLELSDLPLPDLCIRTGGEYRLSNFLLWQLAYTELYFTPILWPDFDEHALTQALVFYSERDRRFGVIHE